MRQGRVIIGKVGEAGTKGRRDKGLKGLRRRWQGCLGGGGLDRGETRLGDLVSGGRGTRIDKGIIGAMTAVASIYTPEGFVIGADGRRRDQHGRLGSDSETKICRFRASGFDGVFTWTGCTEVLSPSSTFNFKAVSYSVIEEIKDLNFDSLSAYITKFSLSFFDRLFGWVGNSGSVFDYPDNPEWSRLQIIGYLNGAPSVARAVFPFSGGRPKPPGLAIRGETPNELLLVFSGSEEAYKEMIALNQMHPCTTLMAGREQIEGYIQRCIQSAPDEANSIGGHIHIAAVLPSGFEWLIHPKS